MAIRRTLFADLGGFDATRYGGLFNDVDLCKRLLQRGRRIRYLADVSILHHRGASTKKRVNEFGSWLWHQNRIAYYRKHHGWLGQAMMRAMLRLKRAMRRSRDLDAARRWLRDHHAGTGFEPSLAQLEAALPALLAPHDGRMARAVLAHVTGDDARALERRLFDG